MVALVAFAVAVVGAAGVVDAAGFNRIVFLDKMLPIEKIIVPALVSAGTFPFLIRHMKQVEKHRMIVKVMKRF
ncbi:hypothetical protein [Lederbergia citrea]|uniref:hypothetical protein n=1 Tax=Lederbergia citrea TaxID=2833581 RepID=UPI001BC8EE53|nr:hypothetical protein [Lederbergia citrea]MBS4176533.1 hypothetical protein [Lederbergia citrea]